MLDRLPILIVEDEPMLAMLLAEEVESLDGVVVATPDTVASALAVLDTQIVAAAIMDANLVDRNITPVALRLLDAAIPFVIYTGTGLPPELSPRAGEISVVMKPGRPMATLVALIESRR
ncbi:response regulator [Sphingobium sp. AN558]|uniref:response regulator n=1 Tax=Sphingobium sp. AN558 TaxID=3133442 RepID=UPI0030C17AFC